MLSYKYSLPNPYPEIDERFLFFDIETTGLQADASSLYLLGCLFKSDDQTLTLLQWFSDSYPSEVEILNAFSDIGKKHPVPVHYNGSSFDLPYLRKKYKKYGLEFPFGEENGIDLYRHSRILKKYLNFPDCRLKTMEQLAGIEREDPFESRELIDHYSQYIRGNYLYHRVPEKKKTLSSYLPALLLHNKEDVQNLPRLLTLSLLTGKLPDKCISILDIVIVRESAADKPVVVLSIRIPRFMEFSFKGLLGDLRISISCPRSSESDYSVLSLRLPSTEMELKFFFENYRDYYYLPYEDMAVHKSVGCFVDKNFRKKATRETCYIKKKGFFLPSLFQSSPMPAILYKNFKDKQGFVEVNEDLIQDTGFWQQYVNNIFAGIFRKK